MPANPALRIATRDVPTARIGETASATRARLRGGDFGDLDLDVVFLVGEGQRVLGAIPLLALIAADDDVAIETLAREVPLVAANADQEHVAMQAISRGVASAAVVDAAGRLVGAVAPSRLLLVLHREHVEDVHKLAGIVHETAEAEHALSDPPLRRARHRLPWLLIGLCGSALATALTSRFEGALRSHLAIAFFVPGIVYLADAIGTQTETVAVRYLSFGAERARIGTLLRGELMTGIALGATLGALSGLGAWLGFADARLALAVAISVLAAGAMSTTIGLLLPWALSRRGIDPAFGSGPLATVVQDVLTLAVYLSIASALATT